MPTADNDQEGSRLALMRMDSGQVMTLWYTDILVSLIHSSFIIEQTNNFYCSGFFKTWKIMHLNLNW